jgi:hypothetical protein
MATSLTSVQAYPSWESLSSGTVSALVNDDTSLDPTLDFLRLQWDLSHSDLSEAVRVLEDAGDLLSRREPFDYNDGYSHSSICETPISAVKISIHELTEWQRIWRQGHADHFYIHETTGDNSCGCHPADAPEVPTLTITAPNGQFVTIGQYVQEVFPWLCGLEQRIRAAIGEFDDPLDPQWSLIPMPLINCVHVYNDRLGADLETMEYVSRLREKVAQRKVHDKEIEAQPSLVGATNRASLRPYPPQTGQTPRMPLSLNFLRLQWCLSSDPATPAVFVVDDPADTIRAGNGEAFDPGNPIAAASIGQRPVSAVIVSVDVLDGFYDAWCDLHSEDDPPADFDSKPRPRFWKKRCDYCKEDAPQPGPGPQLFIQAQSRYHFVTIGQYVHEVLPWLRRLEPLIRRAIIKGSQTVSAYESLDFEWDVVPVVATCALIHIYHNEPRYGRQLLEGIKRRRALEIKKRQEESEA